MGYQPPFYVYTDNLTILGNGTRQNPLYARFPDLYVTQDTVIAEPTDYNFIYITNNATLTLGSGSSTPAVTKVVTMQIDAGSSLILNSVQLNLFSPQPVLINGNIVSTNTNDLIIINSASFILNGNILLTGNIQINSQVTLNGNGQIVPIIYSITITNSQSSATPAPFQQMVQIPSTYIPYIRLTDSSGNLLYAWLESISNGTATIWVKLPNGIGANSSITIYVIGYDSGFDGNYWGEAPQLSSTYGQYDNGASVFNFYDNFAGTTLSPKWVANGASYTVNNGLTYNSNPNNNVLVSATSFTSPYVIDYYGEGSASDDSGVYFDVQGTGANENSNLWAQRGINNGANLDYFFTYTSGNYTPYGGFQSSLDGNMHVYTLMDGANNNPLITQINYSTTVDYTSFPSTYSSGTFGPRSLLYWQWVRVRAYPPNGVMPSTSITTIATPTLTVNSGNTLTLNGNLTFGVNIAGSGAITINSGYTLTINNNITWTLSTLSGSGTLTINTGYTLTVNANITLSIPTISGSGTLIFSSGYTVTINSGYTVTLNINTTINASLSGSGTLSVGSGYTLTLNTNYTISSTNVQLTGSGTLSINTGYTLTIGNNISWTLNLAGSGTLSVNSGYTLTVGANINVSNITIAGAGNLTISSGYTLTQGASITLSVSTVNIAGTWANSGYGITIPSSSTVTVTVTGSLTTSSTAGTLTINGTCYWFGAIGSTTSSSGIPSFPLSFAGSGIFVGAPSNSSSGGNKISLSNETINAGAQTYSGPLGTGIYPYFTLSSLKGSTVGIYGLGTYNSNSTTWSIFLLIYIGTANTLYSINSGLIFASNIKDASGGTNYTFGDNSSGSAGSITITGALYV